MSKFITHVNAMQILSGEVNCKMRPCGNSPHIIPTKMS